MQPYILVNGKRVVLPDEENFCYRDEILERGDDIYTDDELEEM